MSTRSVQILINGKNNSGSAFASVNKGLDRLKANVFSVKGALLGLGAGAAVKALTDGIRERMGEIDDIAKISDRLGIGTENLLALKKAAGLSGADFELLNGSLEKMVKKIGEGAPVFDRLGLSVQDLARQDSADTFGQIADRINAIPGAAERAAVASEIFGKSGIRLINTLAVGSEGFAKIRKEMEQTGESFSRLDAIRVEAANDAIDLLQQSVGKLKTKLAVELAPTIKVIADSMDQMTKSATQAGMASGQGFGPLTTSLGIVLDLLQLGDLGWKNFKTSMADALNIGAQGLHGMIRGLEWISGYKPEFSDWFKTFAEETAMHQKQAAQASEKAWADFGKGSWSEGFNAKLREAQAEANKTFKELQEKMNRDREEKASKLTPTLADSGFNLVVEALKAQGDAVSGIFAKVEGQSKSIVAQMMAGMKVGADRFGGLKDEAARITEANRTTDEIFRDEMRKATQLLGLGLISPETFNRQKAALQRDSSGSFIPSGPSFNDAASSNRFLTRVSTAGDPMLSVKKSSETTAKETGEVKKLIRESNRILRESKIKIKKWVG